jgi:hypothetical protein
VVSRHEPPPTQALTFDDFAPHEDDPWGGVDQWVEPVEDRPAFVGVDPRLLRVGGAALAGVLMIPLALALRDDADEGVRSAAPADVSSTVPPQPLADPTSTVVTVPITAAATAPATVPAAPAAAPQNVAAIARAEPEEPACAGTYTVIFNDFWNRFPKTSGASVEEWLAANNATHDTPLYVGDELCIPRGAQAPAPPPPPTTEAPATTAAPTTQAPTTAPPPPTTAAPVVTTSPPTAAPPPVTTPAPAPAPAPVRVDPGSVEAIIRQVWPDDLEERAVTIAIRESSLRPDAYNGHCCYGLFQIYFEVNRNFLATLGITSSTQLLDARTNATAAYAMYQRSGWAPWRMTDPG